MTTNPLAPEWLAHPDDANALVPSVWSRNARRAASGEIEIAGVTATALAAEFGTPLYVIDEADARARAARLKTAFDRGVRGRRQHRQGLLRGQGLPVDRGRPLDDRRPACNIDVCSGGELAVALAAGVDAARLGFHGNNKSLAEIDRAVSVGVGAIILDSVGRDRARRRGRRAARARAGGAAADQQRRARPHPRVPGHRARRPEVRHPARRRARVRRAHPLVSLAFDSSGCTPTSARRSSTPTDSSRPPRGCSTVHAALLAGGAGARAQPRRRVRHRVHDRRRGDSDRRGSRRTSPSRGVAECAALGIPVPGVAIEPGRVDHRPAGPHRSTRSARSRTSRSRWARTARPRCAST